MCKKFQGGFSVYSVHLLHYIIAENLDQPTVVEFRIGTGFFEHFLLQCNVLVFSEQVQPCAGRSV